MQNRSIVLTALLGFSFLFAGACKTAPEKNEPGRADVSPLGWETPADTPSTASSPDGEELMRIREQNRQMGEQIEDLKVRIDILSDEAAPAAAAPAGGTESGPERAVAKRASGIGSPRPNGQAIAATIRRAGIPDLEITVNRSGRAYVRLAGSLAFRSGQADLRGQAKTRLTRLSEVLLSEYPGLTLQVEGHTDSDPIRKSKWASNETLSMARARAVSLLFTGTLGWADNKVISQGYGSERPIATNSTREGKARNRRIEIVLVD